MNKYIAINPVTLNSGVVRLTKEQASGRMHKLEALGKDCYRIIATNQFKAGEEFGFEGDLPKSMADNLTTKAAAEAAADAEKEAAKAAKEAEKATAKETEEAAKARAKLEADAQSEWKTNAQLREHHGNDFSAFMASVLEQVG